MAVQNVASPAAAGAGGQGATTRADARRPWVPALAVAALTAIGVVLRVIVARQSVFADELSTYWISATHSLGGVLSLLYSTGRIHHAEITPPLSFLASWLTTRAGTSSELLRLPALIAGTATIPLVYLLGLRTVGRRAALLASALTALSPFMIYYSAEARAYGLLMLLRGRLDAVDAARPGHRPPALLGPLRGLLRGRLLHPLHVPVRAGGAAPVAAVGRPEARRPALLANAAAALLVVPWIPGLIQDLRSPTSRSSRRCRPSPPTRSGWTSSTGRSVTPTRSRAGCATFPGFPRSCCWGSRPRGPRRAGGSRPARGWRAPALRSRPVLVVALVLATPVGEIIGSAPGSHIIGVRDLAASWPFLALCAAAVVFAAGRRAGVLAAAFAVIAFAFAAAKMLEPRFSRPNFQAPADYIDTHARAGDVVVDGTGALSPGPTTPLDVTLHRRMPVIRALAPAENRYPFNFLTPSVPISTAFSRAIAVAHGARIFVVSVRLAANPTGPTLTPPTLPGGYARCSERRYEGFVITLVSVYSRSCAVL